MSGSPDLVCAASKNSKGEVVRKLEATGSNSIWIWYHYITTGHHDWSVCI